MTGEDVAPGIDLGSMGDGIEGRGDREEGRCVYLCAHTKGVMGDRGSCLRCLVGEREGEWGKGVGREKGAG